MNVHVIVCVFNKDSINLLCSRLLPGRHDSYGIAGKIHYICAAQRERGNRLVPLFDYMDIVTHIERYLEDLVATGKFTDCFLLDVQLTGGHVLRVFLDGDSGITLETCQKISRYLESRLDESGLLGEDYTLEVSSPGANRPLSLWRQYPKHVGRTLLISMQDGSKIKGKLAALEDETLHVDQIINKKKREIVIPFGDIKESVVQISFK
jgi:ribosome maturation factor RimP